MCVCANEWIERGRNKSTHLHRYIHTYIHTHTYIHGNEERWGTVLVINIKCKGIDIQGMKTVCVCVCVCVFVCM